MTTVAYFQYANIPFLGGSYAAAPVTRPLDTMQTPLAMGPHNAGNLPGQHPNPPQFYPSDGASTFSNARAQYRRTSTTQNNFASGMQFSPGYSVYANRTKYTPAASSSLYTSARKSSAVGQSSLKQGLPNVELLTYRNYDHNTAGIALKRARSQGTIAPGKVGATYR